MLWHHLNNWCCHPAYCFRCNGSLSGGDTDKRKSRFVLYKRKEANGVRPSTVHSSFTPQAAKVTIILLITNTCKDSFKMFHQNHWHLPRSNLPHRYAEVFMKKNDPYQLNIQSRSYFMTVWPLTKMKSIMKMHHLSLRFRLLMRVWIICTSTWSCVFTIQCIYF